MTVLQQRYEHRAPRSRCPARCAGRIGSPIPAETLNVGPRGMRIRSPRPLTQDETVAFDLPNLDIRVAGPPASFVRSARTSTRCASRTSPSR